MFFNIPNILTFGRLILIPFIVVCYYFNFPHHHGITATLFLLGAATDWLDGYLARKWKQTSKLGAFLDPVADKLIVATALCLFIEMYPYWWATIPAIVMICREIVVSALREWMAELGQRSVVKVGVWGKVKTAAQMAALFIFLIKPAIDFRHSIDYTSFNTWFIFLGFLMLYVAVVLTIYSMCNYLYVAFKSVFGASDN
ncbi:CDP-diacylglycerol--glycerol-3-phosphate 3-phosphatidyltransferase [Francisella hispaniensis]|uniref:CDP-diacylglycerol--glycerol-3-phosphate 3-phosphatidyltransferase n=1 Tax=Francisella hispaniensis FSC454 TaxID=1088883 RepID=A0AAC9J5Z9_9GAMM|nr:CDP-diacylglycerol--glycerol-3-phosphate 3-phosphatidyltransferase [Francisella hispaniensis]APD49837.1 CDP-diacylglycerol--glycerol-3-phosphate 3-phosphatidyltransferase [Francisella hispaniensis FSC454]KYW86372.1 CDP-diacylglycerol--glycerol-3-phosphate 3-phosphatidyltransferase [Francisella hispaniensis FSC454]